MTRATKDKALPVLHKLLAEFFHIFLRPGLLSVGLSGLNRFK